MARAPLPTVANPQTTAVRPAVRLRGYQLWVARLALAVLAPVVFLAFAEAVLHLYGFGYATHFLVRAPSGDAFTACDTFTRRFHVQEVPDTLSIPAQKPAGTLRIFIFGESAAWGTPDPSFNFGRILARMLEQNYPDTRFEIVNTAIMGINSHAILPIVRECSRQQPDLFVLYMGNNEAVGYCAPGPESPHAPPPVAIVRAGLWLKSWRVGQWVDWFAQGNQATALEKPQDAAFFRAHYVATDDPRRAAVCENFRSNLADICRLAHQARIPTVLATLAVNLKDQPPLGSLHRRDLSEADRQRWEAAYREGASAEERADYEQAVERYQAAIELDDHFADLHFRLATCYEADTQFDQARRHYRLARYWDALPFRADPRLNDIIHEVASQSPAEVHLADAEQALADGEFSEHRIPGNALFYEHVHLRFAGNYEVARALLPVVSAALADKLGKAGVPTAPAIETCAAQLALTPWDEFRLVSPMVELIARPPFDGTLEHRLRLQQARQTRDRLRLNLTPAVCRQAVATYRQALRDRPDDWHIRQRFGYLLEHVGQPAAAAEQWQAVLAAVPWHVEARRAWDQLQAADAKNFATGAPLPTAEPRSGDHVAPGQPANSGTAVFSAERDSSSSNATDASGQLDPAALAFYRAGVALAQQGKLTEAIVEYRQAVALSPNVCSFQNNLGAALLQMGQIEEALVHLNQAVSQCPGHGKAQLNLGTALLHSRQTAAAIEHLRRSAELGQCPPTMLGQLAWVLATSDNERLRNPAEALQYASEACRQTEDRVPELLDIQAAALAAEGQFDAAIQTADRALQLAKNAGNSQLCAGIQSRLEFYRAGRPFRQATAQLDGS